MQRSLFLIFTSLSLLAWGAGLPPARADEGAAQQVLRVGIVGLDTSHAPAFAKLINSANAESKLASLKVVAAFPGGSADIAASRDRVAGFTEQLREMDVEIVDSVAALLPKVDRVLLLSVDGRKHWPQVKPIFEAGMDVYIDKPLAGNLSQAIAISLLAERCGTRWFSSSSLRFSSSIAKYRDQLEAVQGAVAWSPCSLEATHPDLYWYGIHGVEILYTAMGKGCESVMRVSTPGTELVVGTWQGGRIGSFRGLREGKTGYGLVVFGKKEIEVGGKYEGYAPLVEHIADFFHGADSPVANAETLELMTFMQAADVSKERGGQAVRLADVWDAAMLEAQELLEE